MPLQLLKSLPFPSPFFPFPFLRSTSLRFPSPPLPLPSGAAGVTATSAGGAGADVADGAKTAKVSRMGGLLEPFKDINKGFQLFKPKVILTSPAGTNSNFFIVTIGVCRGGTSSMPPRGSMTSSGRT